MLWLSTLTVLLTLLTFFALAHNQPLQNVIAAFIVMTLLSTPSLFLELPVPRWPFPALWAIIVLNSRAVAKLLLRPWRLSQGYGFWLIALASFLASLIVLPVRPSLIWLPFAAALQFLTVPWLIEKKPGVQPLNYFPLWLWIVLAVGSMIYARSIASQ